MTYGTSRAHNRLSDEEATACLLEAGRVPLEPYAGVMKPWLSRCLTCENEASPTLNNIRRGQGACAWCSGRYQDGEKRAQGMRNAGLEPQVPYPGHHEPWLCQCLTCGEMVSPTYSAVSRGGGCRYCNDTAIDPEVAAQAMVDVQLMPQVPYPGALRPWPCQCMKCGRIVEPCYSTVARGNGGCRWCRDSGFHAGEAAMVYFIRHPGYDAAKIGITNAVGTQLQKHQRRGWEVLLTVDVPGETAMAIEDAVLDWWRDDLGLPAYLGKQEMSQGGWTETVAACEIDVAETMRRIRDLASNF